MTLPRHRFKNVKFLFRQNYVEDFFNIHAEDTDEKFEILQFDFLTHLGKFLIKIGMDHDIAPNIAESLFRTMTHRKVHYHTPIRTLAIFQFSDRIAKAAKIKRTLENWEELAIWFHNAIYYPNFSSNATASARLMESYLAGTNVNKTDLKRSISAVKVLGSPLEKDVSPEHCYIMDLSLSNYCLPEKTYRTCANLLTKEYSPYFSKENFIKKRIEFLSALSCKDKIFHTPYFSCFEEAVRKRILVEIESLLSDLKVKNEIKS